MVVRRLALPVPVKLDLTIGISMKFLAKAPDVQRKLRQSLLASLDDSPEQRPLTYADVSFPEKTPYLEAFTQELLRCARVAEAGVKACTCASPGSGPYSDRLHQQPPSP